MWSHGLKSARSGESASSVLHTPSASRCIGIDRRDATAVVIDVAALVVVLARKPAAHQLDVFRVGRPHGEAHRGRGRARHEQLVGAEPPAVGEVIALGLVGTREREDAVAVGRGGVVHLGGDAGHARLCRRVDDHAPAEGAADLAVVEHRGGAEGRAAIVGRKCLHRRGRPLLTRLAVAVPTAGEPRIAQIDMAKAGAILEVDGNKRHEGPHRLYPSAVGRSLCWRQRWRVCLVRDAMGDLHEVAGRIAEPHGSPTRYKRIKTERSEHHVHVGTHGSELGLDVIHMKEKLRTLGHG